MRRMILTATIAAALGMVAFGMNAQTGSKASLEATPTGGSAPLVVTFTGSGSGELEGVMRLEFGDGQADDSISTIRSFTRTHTYAVAGSYTAELRSGAYGGQRPAVLKTVASVTITVR